jgi:16S rRNA (cytosine967-C5)-methyltransferase
MRDAGRTAAAIEILTDFERRKVPLKTALADWARGARYAGAKDRAWIAGLCLDVLRKRRSLAAAMGDEAPRAATLAALGSAWGLDVETVAALCVEEHGPGALTPAERAALEAPPTPSPDPSVVGDFPAWTAAMMTRAFGDDAAAEGEALAERADVDLRLNTLKAPVDKALAALASVGAEAHPFVATAARIAAPDAQARTPAVTVIPAYNKGWVEVQDLGSQIAAACAGDIKGRQILDFCAGGGGKTLALAALMENKGQIYAYDNDARRLAPLYERAQRAGVRNLQIRSPAETGALAGLDERMDLVFVDAPCTGSGTWRRHPDTKWRLTPQQLERRIAEQDSVLREAARFVKPGGALLYVTCSFFAEENDDRVAAFLAAASGFRLADPLAGAAASGLVTEAGLTALGACRTAAGGLQLSPRRTATDAFYVAALRLA